LAFATALRRRGVSVLYLGADVPTSSWQAAVDRQACDAAVLAVVTAGDRAAASVVAEHLLARSPRVLVASGGAHGADLMSGVLSLPGGISDAAAQLEQVLESARN
jgi:methanogenic corrinoid protein MtbC1